jgi:hypothetical protein
MIFKDNKSSFVNNSNRLAQWTWLGKNKKSGKKAIQWTRFRSRQRIALGISGPPLVIFAERTHLAIHSARASFSSRASFTTRATSHHHRARARVPPAAMAAPWPSSASFPNSPYQRHHPQLPIAESGGSALLLLAHLVVTPAVAHPLRATIRIVIAVVRLPPPHQRINVLNMESQFLESPSVNPAIRKLFIILPSLLPLHLVRI